MFMGVAGVFHRELKLPVVVELTAKDIFLDALTEPHRTQVRDAIRRAGGGTWRGSWRRAITTRIGWRSISRCRGSGIDVVYPGVAQGYFDAVPADRPVPEGRPPTVGYLARICPEKGIERLVER